MLIGEQDAGRIDVEEVDARVHEGLQEVDDVVVVDERVGERREDLEQFGVVTESCAAVVPAHRWSSIVSSRNR